MRQGNTSSKAMKFCCKWRDKKMADATRKVIVQRGFWEEKEGAQVNLSAQGEKEN